MDIKQALAALEAAIRHDERARVVEQIQAEPFDDFELKMEPFSMTRLSDMTATEMQRARALSRELVPPRPVHGDAIAKVRAAKDRRKGLDGARRGNKRHRRTPEDIEAMGARLLAYIGKNAGQRGEQIAAALNTTVSTMRKPMLALIAAKRVRTTGQRRGTCYFPKGRAK